MKRFKILVLVVLIAVCGTSVASAASWRLGIEGGNPSAVVILGFRPIDIKIGYNFMGDSQFLHVSGEYRVYEGRLVEFLGWFISPGVYAQLFNAGGSATLGVGAKVGIGINAYLANGTLEFFAEIAPTLEFLPGIGIGFPGQGYFGVTVKMPNL